MISSEFTPEQIENIFMSLWRDAQSLFDERDLRMIENCKTYAKSDPAGLPGHNLIIIVAKLAELMKL
jgi:hypothetical protein